MTVTSKYLDSEVTSYTVSNGTVTFSAINLGCSLTELLVPARDGRLVDILQGFDTLAGYRAGKDSHNCVVGRFANRIAKSRFTLNGAEYALDANDGENSLHGGFFRWEKQVWQAESFSEADCAGVRFYRQSDDGEQHYPGTLKVCVTYTLNTKNELTLHYEAVTDKATPVNLTNHAYFNLDGEGTVLDHVVQLDCDQILAVDGALIPTGALLDVAQTDGGTFDFRTPKKVGKDIAKIPENIGGYDHCFVTHADESTVVRAGAVWSEKTGIKMEIETNQRGMQMYSGNFLKGVAGKSGVVYQKHSGICFETQRFPDAPNHPEFPSCILQPNDTYNAVTVLRFSTEK